MINNLKFFNALDLVKDSSKRSISEALELSLKENNIDSISIRHKNEVYSISRLGKSIELNDVFDNGDYTRLNINEGNKDSILRESSSLKLIFMLQKKKKFYNSFLNNLIHIRNTNSDLILNNL